MLWTQSVRLYESKTCRSSLNNPLLSLTQGVVVLHIPAHWWAPASGWVAYMWDLPPGAMMVRDENLARGLTLKIAGYIPGPLLMIMTQRFLASLKLLATKRPRS